MIPARVPALLCLGLAIAASRAQTTGHAPNAQPEADVFEDDEVRIPILAGWKRALQFSPSSHNPFHGSDNGKPRDFPITGTLLLQRDGYTLTLAYDTQQVSGVIGGRIIEIFDIPWVAESPGDEWACAGSFSSVPQPAGRMLLFRNLIVDSGSEHTREACNIPVLTAKTSPGAGDGRQRWFGGYFTTSQGGYYIDQDCGQSLCRQLAYTLSTSAKTAGDLPEPDDPLLAEIVQQAIDIVESIEYKKYQPKQASPFPR